MKRSTEAQDELLEEALPIHADVICGALAQPGAATSNGFTPWHMNTLPPSSTYMPTKQ
jgi:hypothetical protein